MKKSLLSLLVLGSLVGCGGGDDDGSSPSDSITDAFIQETVRGTQGMMFLNYNDSTQSIREHGLQEHAVNTDGSYCDSSACIDTYDLHWDDQQDVIDSVEALNLREGKTLRYRTEHEVNGISASEPVSDDGYSRLVTIFINNNDHLTPERRALIVDAVETIEAQVGVKIFNDEFLDVHMNQFDPEDYLSELRKFQESVDLGTGGYYTKVEQNNNLWRGHTYNEDYTRNYDADTARHADDHPTSGGNIIETDSYEEISEHYGVRGGIMMSYGTTHMTLDPSTCDHFKANHSTFPFNGAGVGFKIDDKAYFTNSNWHMVNLGSYSSVCKNLDSVTKDIIVHELGHALGLGSHFAGFGVDGIWDERAIAVLRAIYHNPVATPVDELTVVE